jgi:hypothetical protein
MLADSMITLMATSDMRRHVVIAERTNLPFDTILAAPCKQPACIVDKPFQLFGEFSLMSLICFNIAHRRTGTAPVTTMQLGQSPR